MREDPTGVSKGFKGGGAVLTYLSGTYHPFLGKDVTLHIHSSEGEICAAKREKPPLRKTKNDKEEFDAERHKAYY